MDIRQHFRSLGLNQNASLKEAKQAYKRLVKMWHPDRFSDDSALKKTAEELIKEINVAYDAVHCFLSTGPTVSPSTELKIQRWWIGLSKQFMGIWETGIDIYTVFRRCNLKIFWGKTLRKIATLNGVYSRQASEHAGVGNERSGGGKNFEQVMQEVIREKIRSSELRR